MMDLIFTDASFAETGLTSAFSADFAFGEDENDFDITVDSGVSVPFGALVYVDGSPYGGIVRSIDVKHESGKSYLVYGGDTWQGILGHSIIKPDAGQDHLTVSGDANAILATIITRQGLDGLFDVESEPAGVSFTYQFDRYCTAYSGLAKMLARNGLKLSIVKDASSNPKISANRVSSYGGDGEAQDMQFSMVETRPVNHLICLGEGELSQRVVIDLYADASGNISTTQTLFGSDEISEVYDYNNADAEELLEKGTKRLEEYQANKSASATIPEDAELDIGDTVTVFDDMTGRSLSAPVAKVIVKVSEKGTVKKSYELGDIEVRF